MPFPREEVTPPVTKMYFADDMNGRSNFAGKGRELKGLKNPVRGFSD